MVVLASFIGMPGLGQKLLQLLQALKIGRSIEIGITIVLLAVVLDRCSKAWALKEPVHFERGTPWWQRNKYWLLWAALVAAAFALAQVWPYADQIGRRDAFSLAKPLQNGFDAFFLLVDPYALSLRTFLIKSVLIPLRDAYLWLPYTSVLVFIAAIGWLIGGMRSAIVCLLYAGFIALSGWWDRAMITAYMVSFAVFIAALIGLPLGIWASRKFPSFIYLIPVVMLFGVNDVAAIGAVIVFGMVPMTRYTIEGLRNVPETILEASDMAGASGLQKLWTVKFPLALPTIMVGVNQTVMFSLFMVIIAAFIGTQDLGQEMQRALSSTDVGKGLTLGFCVAFMGLMIDHLILTWASARKRALGLE